MRRLADDLYIIENVGTANIFLLNCADGFILIDSGIFMKTSLLLNQLEAGGFPITKLKTIVLTHCHCDHIGGVSELVKASKAKVAAHRDDIPFILQEAIVSGPYHRMMIEEQKAMRRLGCIVQHVDVALAEGDIIDALGGLEVIHVPGHTPGSIALYQPERKIMFFGDVIRNTEKLGLTVGIPEGFNIDTGQTTADAHRLLEYPMDFALFSHGEPILADGGNVIKEKLALNS